MPKPINLHPLRSVRRVDAPAIRAGETSAATPLSDAQVILGSLRNWAAFATLSLAVPVLAVIDMQVTGGGVSEYSCTEITQELLLLIATVLFAIVAHRQREVRSILLLASGFFATLLVRELDHFWDMIFHGFWVYPAIMVAVLTIYRASQASGDLLAAWARYSQSRSHTLVSIGLLFILVFSRTFGSQVIWKPILASGDVLLTKTVIQEGLELLGYLFVFWGAVELFRTEPAAVPGDAARGEAIS